MLPANPAQRIWHRAKFRDPDTNRIVRVSLDRSLTTVELRTDWAIKKSRELARRRAELDVGAPRVTGTSLEDAIARYYTDNVRLRPGTLGIYQRATSKLTAWAARAGVKSADDLTAAHLASFRGSLVREVLRAPAAGKKRGKRATTEKHRKPRTVNRDLRACRTVLEYVRSLGLLPKITGDNLRDGFRQERVHQDRPEHLRTPELKALLKAALRHDEVTFKETRSEHAGKGPRGKTGRYEAMAPPVMIAMLSGMREGEVLNLRWDRVNFEQREICLRSEDTKTHKPREVDLHVAPAVLDLLQALKDAAGDSPRVFPTMTKDRAKSARKRMIADYNAPPNWGWQMLRRTAGTYMTCSPSIFGSASAYMSSKQLGHSTQIAERYYVGRIKNISPDARTVEAAMGIEKEAQKVIDAVKARPPRKPRSR